MLTDIKIRKAKPQNKTFWVNDQFGLRLEVRKTGKKFWRFRYSFQKKEKALSIGEYPAISLADAREKRDQFRKQVLNGIDPIAKIQERKKQAEVRDVKDSFRFMAEECHSLWLNEDKRAKKSKERRRNLLDDDLIPFLGDIRLVNLKPTVVLDVLQKIIDRGAYTQASRALGIIREILRRGMATGKCEHDFTYAIKPALPKKTVKHHAAIIDKKFFKQLLKDMSNYLGTQTVKNLFFMYAYLFQRNTETRAMLASEISLNDGLWIMPAERLKMRTDHIVPLPQQAIAIIKQQLKLPTATKYVFPSLRGSARPISENTIRMALLSMGYDSEKHTVHGFRASARTLIDEVLELPEKYIEQQLSHTVKDANGRAYNRTKHLKQRANMLQKWADYIDELKS